MDPLLSLQLGEQATTRVANSELAKKAHHEAQTKFGFFSEEAAAIHEQQNQQNNDITTWLAALVQLHGWPSSSSVGSKPASCFAHLANAAINYPHLQQFWLRLLKKSVLAGQADPASSAELEDIIRLTHGHLGQLYGTQLNSHFDVWHLRPISDPLGVAARRESVGLPTLEIMWEKLRATGAFTDERVTEFHPPLLLPSNRFC